MNNGRKKRALVFDDEPDIRQLFQLLLECRGYEVHTFADPSDYCSPDAGICQLAGNVSCADVIISDLKMQRVDGIEFMRAIAAKRCRVPTRALMSGYWTPATLAAARQLGCQTFAKPMKVDIIFNWLIECESRRVSCADVMPEGCCRPAAAFA